jgi:predicted component of type VI protein secretion system
MAPQPFLLIMRTGPNPGKSFELTKNELYIGRDINNDIVINDSEISRKHVRLILQAGGYVLEDLGSTNGTFVNGQRLMGPHVLRPGEMVLFGENVSLAFESGYDADATMVAGSVQTATYVSEPPPQSQPVVQPVQAAAPKQAYAGQVPAGPAEPYYEPVQEPQKSNRTLLYAGIGCLVVLLCGMAIAAAFVFDNLNLYCTPPFNMIFPCG